MNGRVYDYNLGRFLSVDPFIQSPGNSQSMNPYSYIMNNPLSGTDPSGYAEEPEEPDEDEGPNKPLPGSVCGVDNKRCAGSVGGVIAHQVITKTVEVSNKDVADLLAGLDNKGYKSITSDNGDKTTFVTFSSTGGTGWIIASLDNDKQFQARVAEYNASQKNSYAGSDFWWTEPKKRHDDAVNNLARKLKKQGQKVQIEMRMKVTDSDGGASIRIMDIVAIDKRGNISLIEVKTFASKKESKLQKVSKMSSQGRAISVSNIGLRGAQWYLQMQTDAVIANEGATFLRNGKTIGPTPVYWHGFQKTKNGFKALPPFPITD